MLLERELDGMPDSSALKLGSLKGLPLGSALSEGDLEVGAASIATITHATVTGGSTLLEGELDGLPEGSTINLGTLPTSGKSGTLALLPCPAPTPCAHSFPPICIQTDLHSTGRM